ncbi:hypothetical protein ABX050_003856 [Salmonella enterica]|uniref:Uncharacterized protein n=1 Tax=Salmonella enterica subsp. enterica serovar Abeokuta TaxID=2926665 RepID=A0A8T9IQE4_SALET|nr:hypothetical protein [Salmonella enterica]EAA1041259.1 hypothetical protein [Salmonella enterica subsp. enterica serovar Westeinde]EAB8047249.1 hypothetical protein [Salmonella enterica subsp. enterica serovar Tees]EBY8830920.1 hypothetical protein [Salmonella enterica subsp. enterica serovar Schwarzengrund]ECE5861130.1 hypothetical protein [Salmonella enterica subsp. enterica]EDR9797686.1 hypothetical protein [Salmonella enterica subsp. enterica serovar Zongo]EHK8184068.1 hypothetical pro
MTELEGFIKRDNARFIASYSECGKIQKADFYGRSHLIAQWRRTESDASYDDLYAAAYNELRAEIKAAGLEITQ